MSTTDSADDIGLFDERISSYPWPVAVAAGFGAFLVGYALMAAVVVGSGSLSEGAGPVQILTDVGLVFYNAHNVVLNVQVPAGVIYSGSSTFSVLDGSTSLPKVVYFAVPVVALLAVGVGVAWRSLAYRPDWGDIALPAIGVGAGYTIVAALGTFVIRGSQGDGNVTVQFVPDIVQAAGFGLAYSVICVAVGSLAVVVWRRRTELKSRIRS